jgi:hypothetical protein
MTAENRLQILQVSLAKMAVLLHDAATTKIKDQKVLADIADETEKLREELALLRTEFSRQDARDKNLIRQIKEHLNCALADRDSLQRRLEQAEHVASREEAKALEWRDRYYWVDSERRNHERTISRLEGHNRQASRQSDLNEEIAVVHDVQFCPECNEQHLLQTSGDIYRCAYCEQTFRLGFGVAGEDGGG